MTTTTRPAPSLPTPGVPTEAEARKLVESWMAHGNVWPHAIDYILTRARELAAANGDAAQLRVRVDALKEDLNACAVELTAARADRDRVAAEVVGYAERCAYFQRNEETLEADRDALAKRLGEAERLLHLLKDEDGCCPECGFVYDEEHATHAEDAHGLPCKLGAFLATPTGDAAPRVDVADLNANAPWSAMAIVDRLCEATRHLFGEHDCDHIYWESAHAAMEAGAAWLARIGFERTRNPDGRENGPATPAVETPRGEGGTWPPVEGETWRDERLKRTYKFEGATFGDSARARCLELGGQWLLHRHEFTDGTLRFVRSAPPVEPAPLPMPAPMEDISLPPGTLVRATCKTCSWTACHGPTCDDPESAPLPKTTWKSCDKCDGLGHLEPEPAPVATGAATGSKTSNYTLRKLAENVRDSMGCNCEDDQGTELAASADCPCAGDDCWQCAALAALANADATPAPSDAAERARGEALALALGRVRSAKKLGISGDDWSRGWSAAVAQIERHVADLDAKGTT